MRSTGLPMKALRISCSESQQGGCTRRVLLGMSRRMSQRSYDDARALVEQRARHAHGRQRGRLGVAARRLTLQLDGEAAGGAFPFDLMDITWRVGVSDELDLRPIE